jgi:hypothetical protein
MQVQDIDNLAPLRSQTSSWSAPSEATHRWKCLPFHWLEHCQRVDSQFLGFQVEFESAIAIHPSNPRFQIGNLPIALMAPRKGNHLKVNVGINVNSVEVWVVGNRSVAVSTLDDQGHCIAMRQTQDFSETESISKLTAQSVVINTQSVSTLCIDSRSPFILTRFAIQYAD